MKYKCDLCKTNFPSTKYIWEHCLPDPEEEEVMLKCCPLCWDDYKKFLKRQGYQSL